MNQILGIYELPLDVRFIAFHEWVSGRAILSDKKECRLVELVSDISGFVWSFDGRFS